MSERGCGNDAAAYALGALDAAEVEAFEHHLEGCAVCRDEVAEFSGVVNALPMAVPQHPLPRGLRRRILREVRAEQPAVSTRWRPTAAGRWRIRVPASGLGRLAVAAVTAALVVGITLGVNSGGGPRLIRASVGEATLRVSAGRADLIVDHLPPPSSRKIYEMWIERGDGPLQPSTLFSVSHADRADIGVPGNIKGLTRVLVTEEPAGGTAQPTSTPLIVAKLS
ncbi:MAG TPA: anti-sigma factor [Solirubrobacteraceae bacterium]|jgi:anti-sigma-K factor RskA|nr:anti-sigma factor [Solirubrobacteraceae bacterium]